jgi:hypothetical protein
VIAAGKSDRPRRPQITPIMATKPQCMPDLSQAVFKISPERNNCPPSESNSEVKKGFQGGGLDLGLNFGVAIA